MNTVLTFDVGKTSCRACLFIDGVRTGEARRSGSRGIADVGGAAAALARMAEVAQEIGIERVGALAGAGGVVLAAGTGSVAMGVAADGACSSVDGWGFLLGDAGSGYAIGQAELVSALRYYDGRGGSANLAARAEKRFGPLPGLPAIVHGSENPASEVAAFATEVCAAAAAGDPAAAEICAHAGRELARTVASAAARSGQDRGSYRLTVTGGIFDSDNAVRQAFHREVASCASLPQPSVRRGDGCDGARLVVVRDDLLHEQLIHRPEVTA